MAKERLRVDQMENKSLYRAKYSAGSTRCDKHIVAKNVNEAVEKIKKDETCHEEYRIESIVLVAETGNNTHNILIL